MYLNKFNKSHLIGIAGVFAAYTGGFYMGESAGQHPSADCPVVGAPEQKVLKDALAQFSLAREAKNDSVMRAYWDGKTSLEKLGKYIDDSEALRRIAVKAQYETLRHCKN